VLGLLAPTLVALAAAIALGGTLRGLFSSRVRGWPFIVAAFGTELVLYNPPTDTHTWAREFGPSIWLASRLVLLAVALVNAWPERARVSWPWLVVACGLGLNSLVIGLNNGHMPQSPEAAVTVWGASLIDPGRLQNIAPIEPSTRLAWLGDVIAEPAWLPRRNVISIGDIVLALGIGVWVFTAAGPLPISGRRIVARIGPPIHGLERPPRRC
jgi:hypothetical protein